MGRKETIEQAYLATRKAGTCVVVGVGSVKEQVSLNTEGKPKLDGLVTTTYKQDQLDAAFADMQSGVNARGVILF